MGSKKFDFQAAINDYILCVKQKGGLSASDEAELRSHFFDAREMLRQSNLTDEESFVIASLRLGPPDEIGLEYGKLNYPTGIQQIWAYLFLGFGLLTSVKWLYGLCSLLLYRYVYPLFQDSWLHTAFFIGFQLITCVALWSVLKWGKAFSGWLQKSVEAHPWTVAILAATIPVLISVIGPYILVNKKEFGNIRVFNNSIEEFCYYLTVISCILVMVLSIFSIGRPKLISLSGLYSRPSLPFVLLSGIIVEFMAVATRVFHTSSLLAQFALFGIFYLAGSYLISYYNYKNALRLLSYFVIPGLAVEIIGGIQASHANGSHHPVYFVASIIVSVLLGTILGQMFSHKDYQNG
jgi:hypothetical protein